MADAELINAEGSAKPDGSVDTSAKSSPLHSVHTNTFAQILNQYALSIAVTTYQAGKLALLRPELQSGTPVVNTHFRNFRKPMGFAFERGRFALGTTSEIWEFHDLPAVARKLEKAESSQECDAVFLPRRCNMTGNVQIHEMVWVPQRTTTGNSGPFNGGYDANGNLTQEHESGSVTKDEAFTYDLRNRMTTDVTTVGSSPNTTDYGYDTNGVLVKETINAGTSSAVTTTYINDPNNPTGYTKAIQKTVTPTGGTATTTGYVLGLKVEAQSDSNSVLYLLTDGHGSTRALINNSGQTAVINSVSQIFDYDAFGTAIDFTPSSAGTTWLFGGDGFYDPASGWTYQLARWRNGFWFTQSDTFSGSNSDPISLQKYLFADANPLSRIDPSGQSALGTILDTLSVVYPFPQPLTLAYFLLHRTHEDSFTPNWDEAVGQVHHGYATVTLSFPAGSGSAQQLATQIYASLQKFQFFGPNIATAAVVPGNRVAFTTLGSPGWAMNRINPVDPTVQLVNGPGQFELSAVTLGHHMLAGIRRWRVNILKQNPPVLVVETEAYDQNSSEYNAMARASGPGQTAQYQIWDNYLNNIAANWVATAGATATPARHNPEVIAGYVNPWRVQLPSTLQ